MALATAVRGGGDGGGGAVATGPNRCATFVGSDAHSWSPERVTCPWPVRQQSPGTAAARNVRINAAVSAGDPPFEHNVDFERTNTYYEKTIYDTSNDNNYSFFEWLLDGNYYIVPPRTFVKKTIQQDAV